MLTFETGTVEIASNVSNMIDGRNVEGNKKRKLVFSGKEGCAI